MICTLTENLPTFYHAESAQWDSSFSVNKKLKFTKLAHLFSVFSILDCYLINEKTVNKYRWSLLKISLMMRAVVSGFFWHASPCGAPQAPGCCVYWHSACEQHPSSYLAARSQRLSPVKFTGGKKKANKHPNDRADGAKWREPKYNIFSYFCLPAPYVHGAGFLTDPVFAWQPELQ